MYGFMMWKKSACDQNDESSDEDVTMKADKIKIQNLEVFANHGVFPEENVLGQKFVVSAVLYTDTRKAGQTDELTASIHYGEVSAFIDRYLKEHTFQLLEKVAESLAEELLLQTKGLPEDPAGDQKTLGTGRSAARDGQRGD